MEHNRDDGEEEGEGRRRDAKRPGVDPHDERKKNVRAAVLAAAKKAKTEMGAETESGTSGVGLGDFSLGKDWDLVRQNILRRGRELTARANVPGTSVEQGPQAVDDTDADADAEESEAKPPSLTAQPPGRETFGEFPREYAGGFGGAVEDVEQGETGCVCDLPIGTTGMGTCFAVGLTLEHGGHRYNALHHWDTTISPDDLVENLKDAVRARVQDVEHRTETPSDVDFGGAEWFAGGGRHDTRGEGEAPELSLRAALGTGHVTTYFTTGVAEMDLDKSAMISAEGVFSLIKLDAHADQEKRFFRQHSRKLAAQNANFFGGLGETAEGSTTQTTWQGSDGDSEESEEGSEDEDEDDMLNTPPPEEEEEEGEEASPVKRDGGL
jgi:hypothetical protein